ncbi:MAG: hypothetical protein ACN6O2_00555 [Stenotrophomonas sp.]
MPGLRGFVTGAVAAATATTLPGSSRVVAPVTGRDGYRPLAGEIEECDQTLPLEAQVECRPLAFVREGKPLARDIRLLMGRYWLKLIRSLGDYRQDSVSHYRVGPSDRSDRNHDTVCADVSAWQHFSAVAGRAMDGYLFLRQLQSGGAPHEGKSISAALHADVSRLADHFGSWFGRQFHQPISDKAWRPRSLDCGFSVYGETEDGPDAMVAASYHHGRLDWYNLDVALGNEHDDVPENAPPAEDACATSSFFPVQLQFEEMPNSR